MWVARFGCRKLNVTPTIDKRADARALWRQRAKMVSFRHPRTVQLGMRPIAMSFHDLGDSDNT